jgi:hypothetical protein
MSAWRSLPELRQFVYDGVHGRAPNRRREWFEETGAPAYVLWWTKAGQRPNLMEARQRLHHLKIHGPTPYASTFIEAFDPVEANESIPSSRNDP